MAITVQNPEHGAMAGNGFIINATSADASVCEELKAAPATGLSIFVDKLTINSTLAISVTIGEGETTGDVTTVLLGPVAMAAASSTQFDFSQVGGLKLTAATSLTVDASGAGDICITVIGRIE
ncbi:MAG: hypothetical protein PF495_12830 [Spirochaetales bacterium]|jgi:hypothetical protein|nr:hypothetical protein [Spirochaetales bacterium]